MTHCNFRRRAGRLALAPMVSSLAIALALGLGAPAAAQEAGAAPEDGVAADDNVIVVSGIRAALARAEERKRDADVVIDGLTADDIGALPDVSISESLTRISGVTANDTARGSDQVAIRGLGPDLASTEYNGRILPTADGVNRRVGLGGLPSEGLQAAYVQKTPDAATIEGGVAGILLLESIRPLETRRRGLTVVARGLYEDLADAFSEASEQKPLGVRGEVTYVGQLADNLGVALTYAGISDRNSLAGVQFDAWQLTGPAPADYDGNGNPDVLPLTAGPFAQYFNTERHSLIGMVQWEPSDWLRISVDGIFSDEKNDNHVRRLFAQGIQSRGPLGAPTSVTVTNDTVTEFAGTVALYRGVINNNSIKDHTYGGGLNFEIDNGGPLTVNADFSYFDAGRDRFTPVVNFDNDGTTPVSQRLPFAFDITDRSNPQFDFAPLTPEDFAIQAVNATKQDASDKIQAGRLDFAYDAGTGMLGAIRAGLRYDNRRHTQRVIINRYDFATLAARPDLDSSFVEVTPNPLANQSGRFGGASATAFPYFDFDKLFLLGTGLSSVGPDPSVTLDAPPDTDIEEDTYGLYAQADLELGRLSGNVGVRYVLTDTNSRGVATATVGGVDSTFIRTLTSSYDFLLPSLNLKYELTDGLLARFAAARTLSKPLFEDLNVGGGINFDPVLNQYVVNTGNPNLVPFTSDGIDATLEWYPDQGTFVSVSAYYKWVRNFITSNTRFGTIALPDGTIAPAQITETFNDPEKKYFRGVELQVRKDFEFLPGPLSNLGVQANYNYNETDVREIFPSLAGATAIATTVEVLPINLSKHVINAILYYDSKPFNFRLAYRYYSGYSRRFARGYQYQPEGQLDFNFGVRVLPNVSIIGTVTNILDSDQYRLTEDSRDMANDQILQFYGGRGRDYALGVRVNF